MINVGIYGATGYMGGELLRICLEHPNINIRWATTRNTAQKIHDYHPNLYGIDVNWVQPENISACDIYFVAMPIQPSVLVCADLLQLGGKVIDLSAAYRLSDRNIWESAYGFPHSRWHIAQEAVYGITELHAKEIAQSRIVANPGCFSSAAILSLAPLLANGLITEDNLIINGLSGTAGVGTELSKAAHHPEIGNNLVPYNVVNHRHTYEMEQELSLVAKKPVTVHFTPVYVPIVRGILAISHVFPKTKVSKTDIIDCYRSFYAASDFVKLYQVDQEQDATWQYKPYPWVNTVAGTNYCFIGFDIDQHRNRLVVFSVLDSLGKGGAHVAIENLNIMFGLDPGTGLTRRGLHPI